MRLGVHPQYVFFLRGGTLIGPSTIFLKHLALPPTNLEAYIFFSLASPLHFRYMEVELWRLGGENCAIKRVTGNELFYKR